MSKEKKLADIAIPAGEIFEAATLQWLGKDYHVPPDRVFRMVQAIEQGDASIGARGMTMFELMQIALSGKPELTRLADAWYFALRFAGAPDVTPERIYAGMFNGGLAPDSVAEAIAALLALMVPPENVRKSVAALGGSLRVDLGKTQAPAMPQ